MIETHHPIRDWFAMHLVAIAATCALLGVLGWKNKYHGEGSQELELQDWFEGGEYGWPRTCVARNSELAASSTTNTFVLKSRKYSIESWWGLGLDILVAVALLGVTWIVFSRTQRRIQRWWQLSLASIIMLVALAGLMWAIWNMRPIGGS